MGCPSPGRPAGPGAARVFPDETDFFGGGTQDPKGVGLPVFHEQMQGVRHGTRIIHPEFQTVLGDIELGNHPVRGDPAEPERVDLGIGRHESDVGGSIRQTGLVQDHLLGRTFAEYVQFHFTPARLAIQRIFHFVLHQFRQRVVHNGGRPEKRIQKGDPVFVRIILVVPVGIDHGVHAKKRILQIPETEEAPVIRLDRSEGTLEKDGGISVVLVQHHGRPLDRLQVLAILHGSGDHHAVDRCPGGKYSRISREKISLVVVCDRAGQIQGIGRVGKQIFLKVHHHALSSDPVFGRLFLGRGKIDTLRFFHYDIFVESEDELGTMHRHKKRSRGRRYLNDHGRNRVFRSAGRRLCRVRAGMGKEGEGQGGGQESGQGVFREKRLHAFTFSSDIRPYYTLYAIDRADLANHLFEDGFFPDGQVQVPFEDTSFSS